tara:strand:- start:21 stop:1529 length:1509 start_codon:yes stop_codon:yes gene_type:complete
MVKPKPPADKFWSRPKVTEPTRDYASPTGYSLQYSYKDGPDKGKLKIPVDKRGNIPRNVMIARFVDTDKGAGPNRKNRNILVDIYTDAREYKLNSPQQYEWYRRPNKYDISKIDTRDSDLTYGAKGSATRGVMVLANDKKDAKKVIGHLDRNFSADEKKKMNGLIIQVSDKGSAAEGAAGFYASPGVQKRGKDARAIDRQTAGVAFIKLGKNYIDEPKVTVHETVHHLRETDKSRKFPFKAPKNYIGKDVDYEEALTEAETISRLDKYRHKDGGAGYWRYVREQGYNKKSGEVNYKYGFSETLDRYKFTNRKEQEQYDKLTAQIDPKERNEYVKLARKKTKGQKLTAEERNFIRDYEAKLIAIDNKRRDMINNASGTTGVTGKKAINRVKKHFETSRISTMKKKGRVEAIDTYMTYKLKDGSTRNAHFYSPDADIDEKKAAKEAFGTDSVVVWRDGKRGRPQSDDYYTKMKPKPQTLHGKGKGWHGERIRHRNAALKGRGMK